MKSLKGDRGDFTQEFKVLQNFGEIYSQDRRYQGTSRGSGPWPLCESAWQTAWTGSWVK